MGTGGMTRAGGGFAGRLTPPAIAQGLGVFNDNAFRAVTVFTALDSFKGYSANAFFLCFMTVVYVLPFVLFPSPSGYLADRFSKKSVMVGAKFAEIVIMLIGVLTLSEVGEWGVLPVIATLFAMSAQSAFFSPAYNGALPEIFSEEEISRANGMLGMISFLAVIIGFAGGIALKSAVGPRLELCGWAMTGTAVIGFLGSLWVRPLAAADKARVFTASVLRDFIRGAKAALADRAVFVTLCGEAFFYALGASVQSVLLLFGKYALGLRADLELGLAQLVMALGMAFGCYGAGRLSRGKLELGLVFYGAIGMTVSLLCVPFYSGPRVTFANGFSVYPFFLMWLGFLGIFGGLFAIPQRAYQQRRANPIKRGIILAFGNFLTFSGIMAFSVITFALTVGHEVGGDDIFARIARYSPALSPGGIFVALAILTAAGLVLMVAFLPQVALRAVALLFTRTVYQLRAFGLRNLPERGPAILVSNHVSFVDGLLITAAASRPVRFAAHEDFFKIPLLGALYRFCGFIVIPYSEDAEGRRAAFARARQALRDGEALCVFPEGRITRNGIMSEFMEGVGPILPEGANPPIIPVRLGMIWGGPFTYYRGRVVTQIPIEWPCPASVSFGQAVPCSLSAFELRQILSELAADTDRAPRPGERTLHYHFARLAKRHPFLTICEDFDTGAETRAFSLLVRAILLGREIRAMDSKSPYIGVLLPNRSATAATLLGTLMADKTPAMLNFTHPPDTFEKCLRKADIDIILTSRAFIRKIDFQERKEMVFLEDLAPKVTRGKKLFWTLMAALTPRKTLMRVVSPKTWRDLDATAAVLFSSGSTDDPKGVMLSHHNFTSDVNSFVKVMAFNKRDRITGNLPMFHSYGFNICFWIPMMLGAKVVYLTNPLDAAATGEAIFKRKLTLLVSTPTFMMTYIRKCPAEFFKSLRLVIVGAEKARQDLIDKFKSYTGLALIEGYGCTETAPVVSINVVNSILDLGVQPGRVGSVGHPMPGICVKIVDPETGLPRPPGEEGLLLVKGPTVMKGYLKDPERTAAAVRDGWYNTGDIGKMDAEGYISITGRMSRFSKIGGEMVPHEAIEAAIHECLRAECRKVVVVGFPDERKGERLGVFYEDLDIPPEEIVQKLRDRGLPNLWIPRPADFVKIPAFPMLGAGKLDLRAVNRLALGITNYEL